jgi:hypothetical protein
MTIEGAFFWPPPQGAGVLALPSPVSGWFSHTQPVSSQMTHVIDKPSAFPSSGISGRRPLFLERYRGARSPDDESHSLTCAATSS